MYAFETLTTKQKVMSKSKHIHYGYSFQTQPYLMPNNILTVSNQCEIFSYRCRMNDLKYNFPGSEIEEVCICGTKLTNDHLYHCEYFGKHEELSPEYENIFNGTIHEQYQILKLLTQNIKYYQETTQRST